MLLSLLRKFALFLRKFKTFAQNICRCNFKTSPIILPMFQESQRNPWITEMPFGLTKKTSFWVMTDELKVSAIVAPGRSLAVPQARCLLRRRGVGNRRLGAEDVPLHPRAAVDEARPEQDVRVLGLPSVTWKEYENVATRMFQSLFADKDFTDVTLVCADNKQTKSHKAILSSC